MQRVFEAIIRGGAFGVGIGKSITKFTGLPVPWTDSIFAVIVEETGMIGGVRRPGLYMFILWRGLKIARRAPDQFGRLLAGGVTLWIVFEALINMGVMVNLFPFAGNALPLISYGGSSLVATMTGIGIFMNIAPFSSQKSRQIVKGGLTVRLLICAGGTGGGVYPALSVLQALGNDAEPVLWVGGEGGMEAGSLTRSGVPFTAIPAAGVHGVGLRALPGNLLRLARGTFAARRILDRFQARMCSCSPAVMSPRRMALAGRNIPSLVFCPDIEPGLALKVPGALRRYHRRSHAELRRPISRLANTVVHRLSHPRPS